MIEACLYGLRGATGKLNSDSIRVRQQKHCLSLECFISHNELISFQSKYEVEIAAYRNSPPYKNYLKAVAVQNGLTGEDIGKEHTMTESIITRLVNDHDFDQDPRTDCCGEIIRIFDHNRLRCTLSDCRLP